MPLDKKALKARLLDQYQVHLDKVLSQVDDDHRFHISEIENLALDVGKDVTTALTEDASEQVDVDVACPGCQRRMRAKGRKGKWVKTRTSEVRVDRRYDYCETCQTGHFPPR